MSAAREFQTEGAQQRKARSAKLVLVVGLQTRGIAEEHDNNKQDICIQRFRPINVRDTHL